MCFGTIGWGVKITGDELDRLYDAFREAGGNFFDSAHVYAFWLPNGYGSSDRALGEIVLRRGDRRNVILATKGGHPSAKNGYERPDDYLSPRQIASDVADSLGWLGVDRIDLYYLHRDDPRVPVGEIIETLDEHVRSGRLGAIGVSNWTHDRLAAANEYAVKNGRVRFSASQDKFSLAVAQSSKDKTVPDFTPADFNYHCDSQLPLCAYSPTANGYFATDGVKGARGYTHPVTTARLRLAREIAAELGATPNQIALAYIMHQPFPVIPILGTCNSEHLADALGAARVTLTPQQIERLRAADGTAENRA